jgi:arylsulfatase
MVHAPDAEDERVTVTSSARDPGWGLYLKDGKPTFHDEPARHHRPKWQGADALPPG